MKRRVYITLFIVLGIALQFLVHAGIEILYINLLEDDFSTYGLGLSWSAWFLIHHIASIVLLIVSIWLGYSQGKYWWKRIYGEK